MDLNRKEQSEDSDKQLQTFDVLHSHQFKQRANARTQSKLQSDYQK